MMRRLPMTLRTWSGALLVCALLFCTGGLLRSAMAMPAAMPSMTMAAAMETLGSAADDPAEAAKGDSGAAGMHCPMADSQCTAPQAVLVPNVQPLTDPLASPMAATCSSTAAKPWPHAPPSPPPPPDLHELCVSRT
ncbi:DUF6153 family protein [Streptomyces sp. NPDC056527]|uniref:DUF6153 family protein n=1 Tax=Streptomyces sp. NPDC056527 TaxID=3345853 RepID=UPI00367A5A6D